MRVIPKHHWSVSQRRRVRQTRSAHPAPPAAATLEAAKTTQRYSPGRALRRRRCCRTGMAAVRGDSAGGVV